MINDGINNVPDKTIAVFISAKTDNPELTKDRVLQFIKQSPKKRDWFDPHFYRCLPLTIGNQYGFTISCEYDFAFEWKGGNDPTETKIYFPSNISDTIYPQLATQFGHGIITVNAPVFFRTPPGVNMLTINPPNFVIPNVTVMTGAIETDNLRRNFTFNLKIQIPGIKVSIPAGTPLAAFIPIPRYYADSYNLKFADELFSKEIIEEELQADRAAGKYRLEVEPTLKHGVGKHYMLGTDIYGNEFKDHQKP